MINLIKDSIAKNVIKRKSKELNVSERSYTSLLKKAHSFLIIMPNNEIDFHHSLLILNYLNENSKDVTAVVNDFRVSLLNTKFKNKFIDYGVSDISKIKLPTKGLIIKLCERNYDIVIDLNRGHNLFHSYCTLLAKSEIKIGFAKENSDLFYNLQIKSDSNDSEISYNYFINSLKMF